MEPEIVDICSGCGGFSLGGELAGFRTSVAIDIDADLQSSFGKNFPLANPLISDATQTDAAFWKRHLSGRRPSGVIGGPPCQGVSRIGKRDRNDPRNTLISHFYRNIGLLLPKFFVMENVEGLLDDDVVDILHDALELVPGHYRVLAPLIVNAADYGAPTERKRVVVIGYDPGEVDNLEHSDFLPLATESRTTVREAIGDLPSPLSIQKKGDLGWAEYGDDDQVPSDFALAARRPPPEGLGWDEAVKKLEQGLVSGLKPTVHSPDVLQRFSRVTPGSTDSVSRFPRLDWSSQCPTLRAGTGRSNGSHQSMRPIHPDDPRVITVREAARLQGFPDWFVFHHTKWHSFRMIGNSVSPYVSSHLLHVIHSKLSV